MAEQHVSFPKMIISNWWELRKQAQTEPDMIFTPKSIATLLGITIPTVYANVYPALRQFGIITKNGNLSELGKRWLIDKEYKGVCTEILERIYPAELKDGIGEPLKNREAVKDWFHNTSNSNANSVLQMTATYLLLVKGEPGDQHDKATNKKAALTHNGTNHDGQASAGSRMTMSQQQDEGRVKRKYTRRIQPGIQLIHPEDNPAYINKPAVVSTVPAPVETLPEPPAKSTQAATQIQPAFESQAIDNTVAEALHDLRVKPSVNINIQLVLTDETPAEQIDRLFASIAKYLMAK